jgi:hypothetical protein
VFHGLDAPGQAPDEARQVPAACGLLVLIGQDWSTFVIDTDDPGLTRTLVHAQADLGPGHRTPLWNLLLTDGCQKGERGGMDR